MIEGKSVPILYAGQPDSGVPGLHSSRAPEFLQGRVAALDYDHANSQLKSLLRRAAKLGELMIEVP